MILDVQLWELGTQRQHHGLSENILVNTLTNVREFENYIYPFFVVYHFSPHYMAGQTVIIDILLIREASTCSSEGLEGGEGGGNDQQGGGRISETQTEIHTKSP